MARLDLEHFRVSFATIQKLWYNTNSYPQETKTGGKQMESSLLAGINWSNPSWDMFVYAFFVISALLYGVSLGRDRIIVILVSIYMSLAIVNTMPEAIVKVGIEKVHSIQITTFVVVFIALFFLLSRSGLMRTIGSSMSHGSFIQVILFSMLHVGLLISIAMSFLPETAINHFAPLTQTIFTNEWSQFGWIAAPVAAMLLVKGEKKKE